MPEMIYCVPKNFLEHNEKTISLHTDAKSPLKASSGLFEWSSLLLAGRSASLEPSASASVGGDWEEKLYSWSNS